MGFFGVAPIQFGSVSMVTASLGKNDPEPGTVRLEGDEKYIFCYNNGNSQLSVGNAAVVSGVTGYSVTVSSTSSADIPVGIVKHATLTTGTYGWLLVRGFGTAKMGSNFSCVTGQLLVLGADGTFDIKSNVTGNVGPCAKAMGSAASGATVDAYFSVF
jgi:hypothetical protein